jgi:hypothetical protein
MHTKTTCLETADLAHERVGAVDLEIDAAAAQIEAHVGIVDQYNAPDENHPGSFSMHSERRIARHEIDVCSERFVHLELDLTFVTRVRLGADPRCLPDSTCPGELHSMGTSGTSNGLDSHPHLDFFFVG